MRLGFTQEEKRDEMLKHKSEGKSGAFREEGRQSGRAVGDELRLMGNAKLMVAMP